MYPAPEKVRDALRTRPVIGQEPLEVLPGPALGPGRIESREMGVAEEQLVHALSAKQLTRRGKSDGDRESEQHAPGRRGERVRFPRDLGLDRA